MLYFCLQWWRQKSDESAWRLSTRFFMFETYPSQATCVRIFEYGFYFKRYISIESSSNHQCESCDSGFHGQVDFLQPRGPDSRDTAPSIAASSSLTFPGLKKSRVLKKTERVINETTKCMHAYHKEVTFFIIMTNIVMFYNSCDTWQAYFSLQICQVIPEIGNKNVPWTWDYHQTSANFWTRWVKIL